VKTVLQNVFAPPLNVLSHLTFDIIDQCFDPKVSLKISVSQILKKFRPSFFLLCVIDLELVKDKENNFRVTFNISFKQGGGVAIY
jgi:hypothetical protein